MENFTSVQHPGDITYRMNRQRLVNELLKMSVNQLDMQLQYQMRQKPTASEEDVDLSRKMLNEMMTAPYAPSTLKGILDTTGGTTGK